MQVKSVWDKRGRTMYRGKREARFGIVLFSIQISPFLSSSAADGYLSAPPEGNQVAAEAEVGMVHPFWTCWKHLDGQPLPFLALAHSSPAFSVPAPPSLPPLPPGHLCCSLVLPP